MLGDRDTLSYLPFLAPHYSKITYLDLTLRTQWEIEDLAAYGYDQRVEVFGSLGMAAGENDGDTTVRLSTAAGVVSDKPQFFFLERYMASFIAEMKQFIAAIVNDTEVPVGIHAGLMSVVLAKAAKKSLEEHRPVRICELLEG